MSRSCAKPAILPSAAVRVRHVVVAWAALVSLGCGPRSLVAILPAESEGGEEPQLDGAVEADGSEPPEDCSATVPDDLLAATPPMGWDPWNRFGCSADVSESKIKAVADQMVANGMLGAGYRYIVLDDCWQGSRGADGTLSADPTQFPNGMASLASYLRDRGFQLGLYSTRGTATCAGRPGSGGFESIDARTFASWGVKYVKYGRCGTSSVDEETGYRAMRDALTAADPQIVFSIQADGFVDWMSSVAQLWRTTSGVSGTWDSITSILDINAGLGAWAHPGAFNDPDMLEVGNAGITESEMRAQFTLWAVMSAPLIAGNDPTEKSAATDAILTNTEIIAVDQDPLGLQGLRVRDDGDVEVYAKPLVGCGARAVVLLNRGNAPAATSVSWPEIWLDPGAATVRDLWARSDLGKVTDRITATVPPHDVIALKIVGPEPPRPHGSAYLGDLPWSYAANGLGPIERNQSNGGAAANDGPPITLRGRVYAKGLGATGPSLLRYRLGRACTRFTAGIGVDDSSAGGAASFQVWADGEKLLDTGEITSASPPQHVSVDLTGRRELRLFVGTGNEGNANDAADWGDARVDCAP